MAHERSSVFDYVIIVLLALNLCATVYLVVRPSPSDEATRGEVSKLDISDAEASALAERVAKLYNAKDTAALFAEFDPLAKAQFTQEQLFEQLDQLYPIIGTISDSAFSDAVLASSDGSRKYYSLNYKVRLSGGPFSSGTMKLTVTRRGDDLGLMGFFVNGTSQPGGK